MAPATAQTPGSTAAGAESERLTAPRVLDRPPPGRRSSAREVLRTAERVPEVRRALAGHEDTYVRPHLKGSDLWQVAFYSRSEGAPDEEIAQVIVDDRTGRVLEAWTGIQVAWTMARGYPGAFGRRVNAPYVWLGLLVLFVLPFLRPPVRMLHLDLAVIGSLSLSYALFCAAEIGWSVPLAYPPLLYLLGRLLWIARRRGRGGAAPGGPLRPLLGRDGLMLGILFLAGFRLGLNLSDSNVIDVGYAGVIGADRIADGAPLYGDFPADNPRGDTYGPFAYLAYLPFEAVLPWRGEWDSLPAAHAAALTFDLLTAMGLWLVGRRLRGSDFGLLLAYLWLACPWTAFVANSNSNDALVSLLVVAALLLASRPLGRGAVLAAAGLAKFAPLALLPLFAAHAAGSAGPARRALVTVGGAAAAAALLLLPVVLLDGGLRDFAARTIGFQLERESPFSVWGLWDLGPLQMAVQLLAVALALAVAFVPRRRDAISLAALAAAVLIALQLGASHWFYLYVVWFLPPLFVALLGDYAPAGSSTGSIESARPAAEQRMTTALSQGSSSAAA